MERTRRRFVAAAAGAVATAGFGGCAGAGPGSGYVDAEGGSDSGGEGYAAFFALSEFANHAGGAEFEVHNPVPAGTMGHGWEPDAELLVEIAASDLFVYLDTPEFRWAQDAVESVAEDDSDVVVVDAFEGIELLDWDHGEGDSGDDRPDHDHRDGGGQGAHDPHAWVDPIRARRMVDNVVEGLVEADPDNEERYRENAEAYGDELQEVHEAFEALAGNAEHDVAVVAGHNSYRYLEERYGIEFHTPAGVSPHDRPSVGEIAGTVELIDEVGIDYVLYDAFQDPTLGETIVRESGAEEVLPITSVESTTGEWNDRGWGYVEQMEEVNLPAMHQALGVEE